MIIQDIQFISEHAKRFAYPVNSPFLSMLIPQKTKGAYLLLRGESPLYIGRSDYCLISRLNSHEHLKFSTHVLWEPTYSTGEAYFTESFWFHKLSGSKLLLNKIHPARPKGWAKECQLFDQNIEKVLKHFLLKQHRTQMKI